MRFLLATLAATLVASAAGAEQSETAEADFVACLAEKEPALIARIRDADSEEGFVAALKEGVAVCPVEVEGMSMGRLFEALNAHKAQEKGEGA